MSQSVSINYMLSGNIFQEIKYDNFNELINKLELIIINCDSDILIQLLIDNIFLRDFGDINTSILSNLNNDNCIMIVFSNKKDLYCSGNDNGKYILNFNDNCYSRLLIIIINYYGKKSYDIIKKDSYKNLVLRAIKENYTALKYASINLQNDEEVVLEAVKIHGLAVEFASNDLRNTKEIVLEAIKQNGRALKFANKNIRNNKEIILESIKFNNNIL